MRAHVTLRVAEREVELGPGAVVGRLWSAALRLDDGRISEAHALVSLRGRELKLMALRGVMAVDGTRVSEVVLEQGVRIHLAPDVVLEVLDVLLPVSLMGVEGDGLDRQVLAAPVWSLMVAPKPLLVPRWTSKAAAHLWSDGEGWRLQVGHDEARHLLDGDTWQIEQRTFRAVTVDLERAAQPATRLHGRLHAPLRIIASYDTVKIHREDQPVVSFGGIGARLVSELVTMDGPVEWHTLAGEIWRDDHERHSLRRRWDVSLNRLRTRLRKAGIRPDLIKADGTGTFELLLYDGDEVEDRT